MRITDTEGNKVVYDIIHFPDGEVQMNLEPIDRKKVYIIVCRITNAEELFLVDQVMDIFDRQGVVYRMCITYLMGMRMDRVMSFERPFTLKLVADTFNKHNAAEIVLIEPHSQRSVDLINHSHGMNLYDTFLPDLISQNNFQIVLPDEGAKERYKIADAIQGIKARDVDTGKITSIEIENPEAIVSDNLLIVDDLCDGGGTFCGLYEKLKAINPNLKISLYVTHMVNAKGLSKVSEIFDHVYTTNSFADWEESDNVTVFKL